MDIKSTFAIVSGQRTLRFSDRAALKRSRNNKSFCNYTFSRRISDPMSEKLSKKLRVETRRDFPRKKITRECEE